MKMMRKLMMIGAAAFLLPGLSACGKATIQVDDSSVMTEEEVSVADEETKKAAGVEVQCDGETLTQETEAETVGDVLDELKITLGEDDRVTPALTDPVTEGMQIVVNRVTVDTVVETETIEYETSYENDGSLVKGQEQVGRSGENGEKEITYTVIYVDGVEESREVAAEKVTKEAVDEIVKVGTKEETPSEPSSEPSAEPSGSSGISEVSRKAYYDCNGSGHGYYEITYSDGSVGYEDF